LNIVLAIVANLAIYLVSHLLAYFVNPLMEMGADPIVIMLLTFIALQVTDIWNPPNDIDMEDNFDDGLTWIKEIQHGKDS